MGLNRTVFNYDAFGGFATVYSAEHKISKTFAAIKVFDKLAEDSNNDIIWSKEGKSLSKLDHDNIVKFYDLGFYEKDGKRLPYVIIELVKGKHLDEHCKAKDPAVRDVLGLFRSLSGVIEYIHGREKILHLDLKPSNIFVTANRPPRIKLIDFGSSKLFRNEPRRLTRNDFINLLSFQFASPEQFDNDEEIDQQSDIYSLGAILYLLLTERVPFGEGETNKDEIRRQVTSVNLLPIPPSKRVLEIGKETKFGLPIKKLSRVLTGDLDFIVLKCLQKRRRHRYGTVAELNQDIDNFLNGKPLKTRRNLFGYKGFKSLTHLLGLKGGLSGPARWKSPLKRFAAIGALLVVSALVFYEINKRRLADKYPPITKTIEKSKVPMPLKIKDNLGQTVDSAKPYLYIYCGDGAQAAPCFTLLEIPGNSFEMGRRPEEKFANREEETKAEPSRRFSVSKFYLSRFEISNRQWNIVAKSKKIKVDLEVTDDDSSLPKTNISFTEVREFCERLSRDLTEHSGGKPITVRLPSEAEWEYACRAGNSTKYGSGDKFEEDFGNAIYIPEDTPPWVGTLIKKARTGPLTDSAFTANPFGLAAMNGNVWEMVSDRWHKNYNNAPMNEKPWDPIDPQADNKGSYVIRGGSFATLDYMTQCSFRSDATVISRGNEQTGFRLVLEAKGVD